jgi:hypothetical protein
VNEVLDLGMGYEYSLLRTLVNSLNGVLHYENEHDVHDFVQQALRDATTICNMIIAKQAAVSKHSLLEVLGVRRGSSLFSSIMDQLVVFNVVSNPPVFSVETKIWDRVN